jgi:two-component system, NtrC family, response regulator AtoC
MYNNEFNKRIKGFTPQVEKLLLEYDWPGNVRELKNVMERAIILSSDAECIEHLPLDLSTFQPAPELGSPITMFRLPPEGIDIEEVERELIRQALENNEWNQSKAAKKLSLGVDAFRYRMKKFGFLK